MSNDITVRVDPATVQEAVTESVRVAIANALGGHKDALVRAVVDAALTRPTGGYGKSPFATAIDALIQQEAKAAVAEIVAESGPRIREALRAKITADHLVEKVMDTVLSARPLYVQVDLRNKTDDEASDGD